MKVPPIKSNRMEQLKYKARGMVIDSINRNEMGLIHHIHLKPADEHTYCGTLLASLKRIIKGIKL